MSSIYEQSTTVNGQGRFAPSVSYQAAAKSPMPKKITADDFKTNDDINIDFSPISKALLQSQEFDYKIKSAELDYELSLRKLEAEREKEKAKQKDYTALRTAAMEIEALDAAYSDGTIKSPAEYATRRRNIVNKAVAGYSDDPSKVYTILNQAGWGVKDEITTLRKDQNQWVQDQDQARKQKYISSSNFLQSMDTNSASQFIDGMETTLFQIQQSDSIISNPNISEGDKNYAESMKKDNLINLGVYVWKNILGSSDVTFSGNEAELMQKKDEVAKMISAAAKVSYGEAKLAADMSADRVGVSDLANDAYKRWNANTQYTSTYSKYVEDAIKLKTDSIPLIGAIHSLPPASIEEIFKANPELKRAYTGAMEQWVLSYSIDPDTNTPTLHILGQDEALNKAVSGEFPSVTLGKQHAQNHLTPFEISKQIVINGNKGVDKSPYADYNWFMGNNGIQARLTNQAIDAQNVDELKQVATNIKNGDQLINSPVSQGKRDSIVANNPNNPTVQKALQVHNDCESVKEGALKALQIEPDKLNKLLEVKRYITNSLSSSAMRHDVANGKIVLADKRKGFLETVGSLNELNMLVNIDEFNNMLEGLPLEDRNAIIKYTTCNRRDGMIKELQEGEAVQDSANAVSQLLTLGLSLSGIGVDSISQPLESLRKGEKLPGPSTVVESLVKKTPQETVNKIGKAVEPVKKTIDFLTPPITEIVSNLTPSHVHPETENVPVVNEEQTNIKITKDPDGLEYEYDAATDKEFFSVNGVIYNGTIPLHTEIPNKIVKNLFFII